MKGNGNRKVAVANDKNLRKRSRPDDNNADDTDVNVKIINLMSGKGKKAKVEDKQSGDVHGEEWDDDVVEWRDRYDTKLISPKQIVDEIEDSEDEDTFIFRLDFLMLVLTVLVECYAQGSCREHILDLITRGLPFERVNWCEYIVDSIKYCKDNWRPEDPAYQFAGPLTILTMLYVDKIECPGVNIDPKVNAITFWTMKRLKARQDREISHGGFVNEEDSSVGLKNDNDVVHAGAVNEEDSSGGFKKDNDVVHAGSVNEEDSSVGLKKDNDVVNAVHEEDISDGSKKANDVVKSGTEDTSVETIRAGVQKGEAENQREPAIDPKAPNGKVEVLFRTPAAEYKKEKTKGCEAESSHVVDSRKPNDGDRSQGSGGGYVLDGLPDYSLGVSQIPIPYTEVNENDEDEVHITDRDLLKSFDEVFDKGNNKIPITLSSLGFPVGLEIRDEIKNDDQRGQVEENQPVVPIYAIPIAAEPMLTVERMEALRRNPVREAMLGAACRSPFLDRAVIVDNPLSKEEKDEWKWLFREDNLQFQLFSGKKGVEKFKSEVVFQSGNKVEVGKELMRTLDLESRVDRKVLDAWVEVQNFKERFRSSSTPHRLFCGTNLMGGMVLRDLLSTHEQRMDRLVKEMDKVVNDVNLTVQS
ncbi:hypothetical protein SSX86_006914 [Deinandra increscens subsp. villosa]|uniref:Uncharacterized protein n=1 Tax=Deinandra increscens subsp. villosa TaxID=3103831 RepID=A0AAP0DH02_9ASTR